MVGREVKIVVCSMSGGGSFSRRLVSSGTREALCQEKGLL